jgi:hypothetical protein
LVPEIKGTSWTLAQRNAFYDEIVGRGLQNSVIVQSFTYSHVLEATAKGIRGLMLGTTQTAAQMAADGVWGVGVATSTATSYTDAALAAGLKVFVYTVNSRTIADTWITTNGVSGLFSDDAWWVSRQQPAVETGQSSNDPFATRIPWPGMRGNVVMAASPNPRGEFTPNGWATGYANTGVTGQTTYPTASTYGVPLAYTGSRPSPVKLRARVMLTNEHSTQTRWAGIFWGNIDPEVGFTDENGGTAADQGYHFLWRRNGTLDLYRVNTPTAVTSIATAVTGGPTAVSGAFVEAFMELEINATSVTGRVMAGGVVTTITAADTTYRPGTAYFQLDSNGQVAEFQDVIVRNL